MSRTQAESLAVDVEPESRTRRMNQTGPADDLGARDSRAPKIVAKSLYRDLTQGGFSEQDVISLAGELLSLVASGVRDRREKPSF